MAVPLQPLQWRVAVMTDSENVFGQATAFSVPGSGFFDTRRMNVRVRKVDVNTAGGEKQGGGRTGNGEMVLSRQEVRKLAFLPIQMVCLSRSGELPFNAKVYFLSSSEELG
jgi:hypothetical protein